MYIALHNIHFLVKCTYGDIMIEIKGINKDKIKEISRLKNEDNRMLEFRLKAFEKFEEMTLPSFGPLLDINFDNITFYKRLYENINENWNDVNSEDKDLFNNLGVIDAEKDYLEW